MPEIQVKVQRPGEQDLQREFAAGPGPVRCSAIKDELQPEFGPGSLLREGSTVVLLPTVELQAGCTYVYRVFPAAGAGAVAAAAVIQVHEGTVELSIEGSGAPLRMAAPLTNGKVHVGAIREALAAKRLSLVTINGLIPVPDSDGFSRETFPPGSTLTIETAPKPGVKMATAYAQAAPKSWLLSLWT